MASLFCAPNVAIVLTFVAWHDRAIVKPTRTLSADTYTWSTSETTSGIAVTTGGTYTLNITDACGTGSDDVTITELATPGAAFTFVESFLTVSFTNGSTNGGGNNTYLWDFGDGNTSTDVDPTHIYGSTGTYMVTLTVTNECGTDVITDSVSTTITGMEDILVDGGFVLFPNPTNDQVSLSLNLIESGTAAIRITDLAGRTIKTNQLGDLPAGQSTFNVNLDAFSTGTYLVELHVNGMVHTEKLIVRK